MRIESALCGAVVLLCTGTLAFSARAVCGQQETYEIVSRKNLMVPMRDGVKLATDIYLPAKDGVAVEGRFPVILQRTPYGKAGTGSGSNPTSYVPCGYVMVKQDTRGRGGSEGIRHWIFDSAATGSRQSRDPALKAALTQHSKDRRHYLLNLPLRRGLTPLRLAPEYEDMLIDMMEHGANDEFWRFSNIIEYADEHKDIPVFMVGGWYDLFSSSTSETYMALKKTIQGPVYLLMGPWIHNMQGRSNAQIDFGPDGALDLTPIRRAWYDRWLKGVEADFDKKVPFRTPVRLFAMGTGERSCRPHAKGTN